MAMIQLATDNFNRANENPLSGGGNWATIATYGNLQVVSNQCEATTVGTNANQFWQGGGGVSADGNWANDQYAEMTIGTGSVAAQFNGGPGVRLGAGTGYILDLEGGVGTGTPVVFKLTGSGAYASVHTYAQAGFAIGDVWRMQIVGTTITVFKNGTSQGNFTDSTYSSGAPGLYLENNTSLVQTTASLWAAGANQAATPTFNPVAGSYAKAQNVVISSTTPGGVIFYTTNGSTPTHSSPSIPNGGSVSVSNPLTLQAFASVSNFADSTTASAVYSGALVGGSWLQANRDFANKRGIRGN